MPAHMRRKNALTLGLDYIFEVTVSIDVSLDISWCNKTDFQKFSLSNKYLLGQNCLKAKHNHIALIFPDFSTDWWPCKQKFGAAHVLGHPVMTGFIKTYLFTHQSLAHWSKIAKNCIFVNWPMIVVSSSMSGINYLSI